MMRLARFFDTSPTEARRIILITLLACIIATVAYFNNLFFTPRPKPIPSGLLANLPLLEKDSSNYAHRQHEAFEAEYSSTTLFYFDPNTATDADWKKLGLTDQNIQRLRNFQKTGWSFKSPTDIHRIYGINPSLASSLEPYIRISGSTTVAHNTYSKDNYQRTYTRDSFPAYKPRSYAPVNINIADSTALIDLPGIGPGYARRILNYRNKLGGFYSVDQIKETYGLPDSVFTKLKPYINIEKSALRTMNINTDNAADLKHPYIRYQVANAIVAYRKQHGNFTSIDQITKVHLVHDTLYQKIAPYLKLN